MTISKTAIAAVILLAAGIAGIFGYSVSDAAKTSLTDLTYSILTAVGGLVALIERIAHSRTQEKLQDQNAGGSSVPIVLLAVGLLFASGAGGCGSSSGFYGSVRTLYPVIDKRDRAYVMQDPTLGPPGELTPLRQDFLRTNDMLLKAIELEGGKQSPAPTTAPVAPDPTR